MDLSALTDAPADARPSADNEAAMLLLGLFEQPSPLPTPSASAGQGQLQGYQAERAPSHPVEPYQSSRLSPAVATKNNNGDFHRRNGPSPVAGESMAPRSNASPAQRPESLKSLSPMSMHSSTISSMSTNRMLPPVPPSVAQQQAQQAQSQSQHGESGTQRHPGANGTNAAYRMPEPYHAPSAQSRSSAANAAASYSHQPLTAATSKSPLLQTASPKQGYTPSAPVMGTFNRAVNAPAGSPGSTYVAPVISTGQNRISHLLNNPASSTMPPSPGRNGHGPTLPYHTHTYSSQPYKLVSTNNNSFSSTTSQGPAQPVKAPPNTSRTVYSGKHENGHAAGETQSSIRGYDSTAVSRMNGTMASPALHYSIPVSPYMATHQVMQAVPSSSGSMQYVSMPGKGIVYAAVPNMEHHPAHHPHQHHVQPQPKAKAEPVPPTTLAHQYIGPSQPPRQASPAALQNEPVQAQPVVQSPAQTPAPRKRKRSGSGSTASTKGLQPKAMTSGAASVMSNGSNARPELPHFMGFDNQLYRCICETTIEPERGSSIQCERCLAWQHAGCFGISEDTLEGLTYFCHICKGGSYSKNDEYIAYVRDLETRLMSGQVVSGILSVNPTLQLVPETAATRDSKKTRGGARGRPRARENSTVSTVRPSVPPPDSAATESFPTDPESTAATNANDKPLSAGANMPRQQRRRTGTARAPKQKSKEGAAAAAAGTVQDSTAPATVLTNTRPSTGNASRPTTHSPDRETQRATRETTVASITTAAVVTESSAPLRLLQYIPIQQNILRGQFVGKIVRKFLAEWAEHDEPVPSNSLGLVAQDEPPSAPEVPTTESDAQKQKEADLESSNAFQVSQDVLGPPIPPAIIKAKDLEDAAVPTYVKAKDKDEVFFFPPGRAFLSVPDPKDAPATPPVRPSPVYGVHVRRTALPGDFLGEFKGEVVDSESYHRDPINQYATLGIIKPFTRRLGPPIDLVVDGRIYSNDMRFVRSGCHPNAVFRPIIHHAKGSATPSLSFGVFATSPIAAGQEVILGWEWDDDHVIHTLRADGPTVTKGSRVHHRCALVTGHLLGTFRSCACEDGSTCVWMKLMQLSVAGQPIPALSVRTNKKSRKARDTSTGYGPLVGAIRGWRRNEIARFEAELETELLEQQNAAFEAEQVKAEDDVDVGDGEELEDDMEDEMDIDEAESVGDIQDDVSDRAKSLQPVVNVDVRKGGEKVPVDKGHSDQQPQHDAISRQREASDVDMQDAIAVRRGSAEQLLPNDVTSRASPEPDVVSEIGELDHSSEDDASDMEDSNVDMDQNEDDKGPAPEEALAGQTHSPREDFVQTPPAPETVEPPSIVDVDRHSSVDVMDASFEGVQGTKSLLTQRDSSSLYTGRAAEDDSPLTSADTRETPSPLLLSADNAFARQMTADGDQSDEDQDEEDGNNSDSTASTVPLSRHSDDDDNLLSEPESVASQAKSDPKKSKQAESLVPLPRTLTPTNGKVVNTAYKRRRVMSPSSPIDEGEHSLTPPPKRDLSTSSRKRLERAPSSSLSPVLASNSLADMFDEEDSKPYDRHSQSTPTNKTDRAGLMVASSSTEVPPDAQPTVTGSSTKENSSVPAQTNGLMAHLSGSVVLDSSASPALVKSDDLDKPPGMEAATSSQPEAQPDQAETEPAPPPKKRRLDLKKFMTAKLHTPAETTTAPIETPVLAESTGLPLKTTEQPTPVITEEPSASFSPASSVPPPPVAPPPPPPPAAQSPLAERPVDGISASPWWTATPKSRPSFTSYTESRPHIMDTPSIPSTNGALGVTNMSEPPADINKGNDNSTAPVTRMPEPPVDAPAAPPPPFDLENKHDAPRDIVPSNAIHSPLAAPSDSVVDVTKLEEPQPLPSPLTWQAKLPLTAIPSHWSRIPPALERKDLPPHVDPDSRPVDRFGPVSSVSRSPPKISLPLMSPQRVPPAGPRALAPVRPLDLKDARDVRETDRERDLRDREREREVPRGPRMEYRGRGSAPRGSPFTPRGGWHGDSYRGRGRGTGEFRGRGFFPRGRGAFFNSRGRGA